MPGNPGAITQIGIAKESTWGTAVTATDLIPVVSGKEDSVRPRHVSKPLVGTMRAQTRDTYPTTRHATLTFSAEFRPGDATSGGLGHVLMGFFGTDTVTGAGPYVHTFSVADTTYPGVPSYTVTVWTGAPASGSVCHSYAGMVVQTLKFAWKVDGPLMVDVTMIGKAPATNVAKPTLTVPTVGPLMAYDTALTVGGAGVTSYQELGLELDRSADAMFTLGSADPRAVSVAPPTGTFDGTALFDDMTEMNRVINASDSTLVIATGTTSPLLTWTATSPSWDEASPERSIDGLTTLAVSGELAYNATDLGIVQCVLTNARSTAY